MADPKKTLAKIQQETEEDLFGPAGGAGPRVSLVLGADSRAELSRSEARAFDRAIKAVSVRDERVGLETRLRLAQFLREERSANPKLLKGSIPSDEDIRNSELLFTEGAGFPPPTDRALGSLALTEPAITRAEVGEALGGAAGAIGGSAIGTLTPAGPLLGIPGAGIGGTVGRQIATQPPSLEVSPRSEFFRSKGRLPRPSQERTERGRQIRSLEREQFELETGITEREPLTTSLIGGARQSVLEGLFQGAGRLFRAAKGPTLTERSLARPEVQLGEKLGVELPLGVVADSPILRTTLSILERTIGSEAAFKEQSKRTAANIVRNFDEFAIKIFPENLSRREVGIRLGETLTQIEKSIGRAVGRSRESVRAIGIPVQFSEPQLASFNKLALQAERVDSKAVAGEIRGLSQIRTIDEALDAQLGLRELESVGGSAGGAAKRAKVELKESIDNMLESAGFSSEVKELRAAEQRFAVVRESAENTFIKSLNKLKRPEAVAAGLLNKNSGQSAAIAVREIFGPGVKEIPPPVRRAIVEELALRSQTEGIPVGGVLERQLTKTIREDVIREVLPKREADFVLNELSAIVDFADLSAKVAGTKESATLLALGQSGIGVAAITAPLLQGDLTGTALGVGIAALSLGAPALISKIITRKGGIELLRSAAKTKTAGVGAGKLLTNLVAMALSTDEPARQRIVKKARKRVRLKSIKEQLRSLRIGGRQ